ncbi:glutathione S-transferase family protein [Marinagarivorans algicola]|uniref:glutathione S-transferase family protein n=1 Tax=Marinagarivorans algicola TaxID=1513270 RepID=UPI0006B91FC8|nr:glutathione S-transferase [Marinagarivorans algicola]
MNTKFAVQNAPIKLYRNPLSGHCHRVELMLSLLDIPYETIDLDMANGAHKAPDYLKISPFGQVPAIDDNGITLADSNAIITYLEKKYNDGYAWYPQDPVKAAEVQRWLSVAAGEIAYGPCAVRLVKVFGVDLDYDVAKKKTDALFAVIEPLLNTRPYLAGEAITLADVAGYSYISHVPEGGVSLEPYPAIRAWLERIEAHPRFVGMKRTPVPA